jgi:hypothetical protein
MFAIDWSEPLQQRGSRSHRRSARGADHHRTPSNDRLLVGNRNHNACIKRGDRCMNSDESRCRGHNNLWRSAQYRVTQLRAAKPSRQRGARMRCGKAARRSTLAPHRQRNNFKSIWTGRDDLQGLSADRTRCANQRYTLPLHLVAEGVGSRQLQGYRGKKRDRRRQEKAIDAIEDSTVPRDQRGRIFCSGGSFKQRLD